MIIFKKKKKKFSSFPKQFSKKKNKFEDSIETSLQRTISKVYFVKSRAWRKFSAFPRTRRLFGRYPKKRFLLEVVPHVRPLPTRPYPRKESCYAARNAADFLSATRSYLCRHALVASSILSFSIHAPRNT